MIDLRKINLNLLLALDALLSEKHVTKAAEKLFLTQSAMSNSLNQLRNIFDDQLLIRGPKGMLPTALATQIHPQLKILLESMSAFFTHETKFNPATSDRVFNIGMSDHAEFLLLPKMLKIIEHQAPNIELAISRLNYARNEQTFTNNEIELGIGSLIKGQLNLMKKPLLEIKGLVVARKDHPLMQKKITLKRYLNAKHIRILYRGPEQRHMSNVENALANMGESRDTALTLQHVLPVLFTLQESDLIATVPNILSPELADKLGLAIQPIPFKVDACKTYLLWHASTDEDLGLKWLRSVALEAAFGK